MVEFSVIIPARFASLRLPGKPLRDVAGKTLIQRTYEAVKGSSATRIVVATDDDGISQAVQDFGGEVCLTSVSHQSGTDRVAEAASSLELDSDDIVVNVQGDEPDMPGGLIDQVVAALVANPSASVATAAAGLDNPGQFIDPAVVKVVTDEKNFALYFSRAGIPFARNDAEGSADRVPWRLARRHIGIYAYRVCYLHAFTAEPVTPLEASERLEQLRALWRGDKIVVVEAREAPSSGVDTLDDLEAAIRLFSRLG